MTIPQNTPLLLLHGFPLDARMWRHTVAHFSPKRPVVAPNANELVAAGPTMQGMAAQALEALDSVAPDKPAVVVGLSMGGYIAAEFARAYPNRVAGLVMCDTRAGAEPPEGRAGRDSMIEATREHGVTHGTAPLVARMLHDPPQALMAEVHAMVEAQDPEVVIACIEAMRDRRDNTGTICALSVPYIVIAGEHDALASRLVEESLAALNPKGRFVEIPRSGHIPPLENPSDFNAVLEKFLVSRS